MPRSQGTSRKGKPKKGERAAGMGRALEKSQHKRFKPKSNGSSRGAGMAMAPGTADIGLEPVVTDNMKSILEVDDLTDFLQQTEMAGREFESERERFVVLDSAGTEYRPSSDGQQISKVQWSDQNDEGEAEVARRRHRQNHFAFHDLSVPRRPEWNKNTTPDELDRLEKESFLNWRRSIAEKEEELQRHIFASGTTPTAATASVTPFEKNIQVWKQLWRVLERSSCVIQVVDARNPLFYLSTDLRTYAEKELGKPMMLIINKSDFLTKKQRQVWHTYFKSRGWEHLFFSAVQEQKKLDEQATAERHLAQEVDERLADDTDNNDDDDGESEDAKEDLENDVADPAVQDAMEEHLESDNVGVDSLLTQHELIEKLDDFGHRHGCEPDERYDNRVQFGMVGFPNVGKSSVINVLVGASKHTHGLVRVAVAAQPGKTKHFQTLLLPGRDDMMLCDCPGLVFPSFVSSAADLIAAGVYPIAQMRDHWPVVELICRRIPRQILNAYYGIKLPAPSLQDLKERGLGDSEISKIMASTQYGGGSSGDSITVSGGVTLPPPTAEELLTTYCVARSILAPSSGVPDYQRASRVVISDYVVGKLLYCHPPPNVSDMSSTTALKDVRGMTAAEADFQRDTIITVIRSAKKLRDKMGDAVELSPHEEGDENDEEGDEDDGLDNGFDELGIDDDILDMVSGFAESGVGEERKGDKRGKAHKSMRRKKKKGVNKDPYGCHSDPDAMFGEGGAGSGITVNAGKYTATGYTRLNYSGARGAVPFEKPARK